MSMLICGGGQGNQISHALWVKVIQTFSSPSIAAAVDNIRQIWSHLCALSSDRVVIRVWSAAISKDWNVQKLNLPCCSWYWICSVNIRGSVGISLLWKRLLHTNILCDSLLSMCCIKSYNRGFPVKRVLKTFRKLEVPTFYTFFDKLSFLKHLSVGSSPTCPDKTTKLERVLHHWQTSCILK